MIKNKFRYRFLHYEWMLFGLAITPLLVILGVIAMLFAWMFM